MNQNVENYRGAGLSLFNQVLGFEENYLAILRGGPQRSKIIGQLNLQFRKIQPEGQESFMKRLFETMAEEGKKDHTNKADAGLEVLKNLVKKQSFSDPLMVLTEYNRSVASQTTDSDPYLGSIYRLLEAGKIMAPILAENAAPMEQIMTSWSNLVNEFSTEPEVQAYIGKEVKSIGAIALYLPLLGKAISSEKAYLLLRIEEMRNEGYGNKQIAEILDMQPTEIATLAKKLFDMGRIEKLR